MATAASRSYAGESAEERVQRRHAALVQAALALSGAQGWRQVSVDRVCQEAQLNKRYFYENFTDLDALASAVVEHVAAGAYAALESALAPNRDIPQMAHAAISALVRYLTDDPQRARLLFGELTTSEAAAGVRKRAMQRIAAEVARHAREIHREPTLDDSIGYTAASFFLGGTGQAILAWLDGQLDFSREQLIDDLVALWLIGGDGAVAVARKRAPNSPKR